MKLPWGFFPSHWGLKGKTAEIAKAEYELSGYELEMKLAKINDSDREEILTIQKKYKKITEKDYKYSKIKLDMATYHSEKIKLDFEYGIISQLEMQKQTANIEKKPWVSVKDSSFDPTQGPNGFSFELDFNEYFVEMLRNNGFDGKNDEDVVDDWYSELCKQVALEDGFVGSVALENPDYQPMKVIRDTVDGKTVFE